MQGVIGPHIRFNPGLELANAVGVNARVTGPHIRSNPGLELANAFGVNARVTGPHIRSNPGLELANAFGVNHASPTRFGVDVPNASLKKFIVQDPGRQLRGTI